MSTDTPTPDNPQPNPELLASLALAFPYLKPAFIRAHQEALMDKLRARNNSQQDIESVARTIPDILPKELFSGFTLDNSTESEELFPKPTEPVPSDNEAARCQSILSHYSTLLKSGDISGLCILATKSDGNMEMAFTEAKNLFTYYGFMTHAINATTQTSRPEPEDE